MSEARPLSTIEDDPALPGWRRWMLNDPDRFTALLGPFWLRRDGDRAYVRMMPERQHSNMQGSVHGGAVLAFIDESLFAGARLLERLGPVPAVTADLSNHFLSAALPGQMLEAEVEVLHETGNFLFLRGLVTQQGARVASFTGTIRKFRAQ